MHVRATRAQRFVAFLIDTLVIGLACYLIGMAIRNATGFQKELNAATNGFFETYEAYIKSPSESNLKTLNEALGVFLQKFFISSLISAAINFVLIALYLVILPYFWSAQTLGRALAKVKVVTKDAKKPTIINLLLREQLATFVILYVTGILSLVNLIVIITTNKSLVDYIGMTELESVGSNYGLNEEFYRSNENNTQYSENEIRPNFKEVNDDLDNNQNYNNENNDNNEKSKSNDDEYKIF